MKQDVLRDLQGCLRGVRGLEVSRMFQGCYKDVSRVLTECFKGVSRKFGGCFN